MKKRTDTGTRRRIRNNNQVLTRQWGLRHQNRQRAQGCSQSELESCRT